MSAFLLIPGPTSGALAGSRSVLASPAQRSPSEWTHSPYPPATPPYSLWGLLGSCLPCFLSSALATTTGPSLCAVYLSYDLSSPAGMSASAGQASLFGSMLSPRDLDRCLPPTRCSGNIICGVHECILCVPPKTQDQQTCLLKYLCALHIL